MLRKDETAAGQTYKYAKVVKVHVSTDGRVRAADIEYKLPGESVFRMTTRPIHKLVLIIPIEEQASTAGQAKENEAEPVHAEAAGPAKMAPLEMEPESAGQEEAEAEGRGGFTEAAPAPPRMKRGQQSPPSSSGR